MLLFLLLYSNNPFNIYITLSSILQSPSKNRHGKLIDALELQQFLRDIEDEEDWIREKEPIASSANKGLIYKIIFTI